MLLLLTLIWRHHHAVDSSCITLSLSSSHSLIVPPLFNAILNRNFSAYISAGCGEFLPCFVDISTATMVASYDVLPALICFALIAWLLARVIESLINELMTLMMPMTWRRSRLAGLFQLLEKFSSPSHDVTGQTSSSSSFPAKSLTSSLSCRYSADDIQQLRYTTSKILQHLNAQG